MQTFLPYSDYAKSAKVLDNRRLGKQRVETLQIMKAILQPDYGWQNHPAVKMWRNHAVALLEYQVAICNEWTSRGYKDTCLEKTLAIVQPFLDDDATSYTAPNWVGDDAIHLSHRSNLLRKDAAHYGPLFEAGLSDKLPYIWPVS